MIKEPIEIKFRGKSEVLDWANLLVISGNLEKDINDTLMQFAWVNTVVSLYEKKTAFAKIARDKEKAVFFMDAKASDTRPPSDKTVEWEMAEEEDLIKLDKTYIKLKAKLGRLVKMSEELKIKLEILRTLMANQRAEMNLQH